MRILAQDGRTYRYRRAGELMAQSMPPKPRRRVMPIMSVARRDAMARRHKRMMQKRLEQFWSEFPEQTR
jgi:hypothetical protein